MKRTALCIAALIVCVWWTLQGSGFTAAVVPQAVPSTYRTGSSTSPFQLQSGSHPAGDCPTWDAQGNMVDSGIATCGGAGTAVNSWNGRVGAVLPALNDYGFSLLSGTLATAQVAVPQGIGAKIQTSNGSPATDACAKFDSNGTLVSAGGPCSTPVTGNLLPWQPSTTSTPAALVNWTQVNGGGNGTFADVRNAILINSVSGNNLKELYVAAPGASGSAFTVTGHVSAACILNGQVPSYGILVGDTGNKVIVFGVQGSAAVQLSRWTNSTTFSANPYSQTINANMDFWFRIVYDGSGATNTLSAQVSPTGSDAASFVQETTEAVGTFLASNPAKLGFFASSQNSALPCVAVLGYWSVTQP